MSATSGDHRRVSRVPLRTILLITAILLFVGTVMLAGLTGLRITILTVLTWIGLFNLIISWAEVIWRNHSHRTPEARKEMVFPESTTAAESGINFALILPALNEAGVIRRTMAKLAAVNYGRVKTYVSLRGQDIVTGAQIDPETVATARDAASGLPADRMEVVVSDYNQKVHKGKPHQLNAAFRHICTTSDANVIGVFDAEDDVHPELLAYVARIFQEHPDVDIVQAGVQLMNYGLDTNGAGRFKRFLIRLRGWFCVHNVLEYFFWFSSRMAFQVKQGTVPLGGNTVFIRRELLEKMNGWPTTLTEDCSLGIRAAARYGAKVHAIYDPRFVTKEETPHTLSALIKQRVRWDQGFLEEFLEGYWRDLKGLKQKSIAAYILAMPFIQAFNGVMLPISIAIMIFGLISGPVLLVLFMFAPLVPVCMTIVLQIAALQEFSELYNKKLSWLHYASLVLGFFPYQVVLAFAALRSIWNVIAGHNDWHLTAHYGLHRELEALAIEKGTA